MVLIRKTFICFSIFVIAIVCFYAQPAFAIDALDEWDNAARQALSTPIKIWLGLMVLTNIATNAFLKKHIAARWVLAGFILSHLVGALMVLQGMHLLAGQVSLLHIIFWTPGMIALIRHRQEIELPSAYGIWAMLSLIFYFGSMFFDVPDALTFLQNLMAID